MPKSVVGQFKLTHYQSISAVESKFVFGAVQAAMRTERWLFLRNAEVLQAENMSS
jgi:hypothetical protein